MFDHVNAECRSNLELKDRKVDWFEAKSRLGVSDLQETFLPFCPATHAM